MRPVTRSKVLIIAGILTALAVIPSSAAAEEWASGMLEGAFYAGFFDTAADSPPVEAGFELRRTTALERLSILGGLTANSDSGAWIYGGARYDFSVGELWTVAPGFAVTLYEKGDGKELGQALEFRSSIELARRISERFRVGFVFYHLSNSSLSETNPGANSAVFSLAFRRPGSADE
jgi:hypothetical protein